MGAFKKSHLRERADIETLSKQIALGWLPTRAYNGPELEASIALALMEKRPRRALLLAEVAGRVPLQSWDGKRPGSLFTAQAPHNDTKRAAVHIAVVQKQSEVFEVRTAPVYSVLRFVL